MGDSGQAWRSLDHGSPPKPIAIIGMSCRLPAGSTNVENLWTMLASGQSGWSPHPPSRLMPDTFYHPNPDKKGTYDQKGAHYVQEDIGLFDAAFFNVKAAEATVNKFPTPPYDGLTDTLITEDHGPSTKTFTGGHL